MTEEIIDPVEPEVAAPEEVADAPEEVPAEASPEAPADVEETPEVVVDEEPGEDLAEEPEVVIDTMKEQEADLAAQLASAPEPKTRTGSCCTMGHMCSSEK